MKNVKITDAAHRVLKIECAKKSQKLSELLSNLILSSISGEDNANIRNQDSASSREDG